MTMFLLRLAPVEGDPNPGRPIARRRTLNAATQEAHRRARSCPATITVEEEGRAETRIVLIEGVHTYE